MYSTPLDRAIGHYLVDSGSSWAAVAEYLGLTTRAMRMKRIGTSPFTAKETRLLADLLGTDMDKVYDLMPEQTH